MKMSIAEEFALKPIRRAKPDPHALDDAAVLAEIYSGSTRFAEIRRNTDLTRGVVQSALARLLNSGQIEREAQRNSNGFLYRVASATDSRK